MPQGKIEAIALKPEHRGAMQLVDEASVTDQGLDGNGQTVGHRRLTFISKEQWHETLAELGADLPWHTRRANVLVDGLRAPDLLRKTLKIGGVRIQINGETEPCERMDEIHQGLRKALEPDCRGGVYGSVLQGGPIRPGDTIEVLP